jgi:hypothetical protein
MNVEMKRNFFHPNYYVGIPTWLAGDLKHPNLDVYSTSNFDLVSTRVDFVIFRRRKSPRVSAERSSRRCLTVLRHLNSNSKLMGNFTQKFTIELCSFSTR